MKKNAFLVFGLLLSVFSAGAVVGKTVSTENNYATVKLDKITLEQARKFALKKVDGTVEDEYTIEDENENITTYVFVIKDKKGKTFEVQIDATNGDVLSSDEVSTDSDEEEDDPSI